MRVKLKRALTGRKKKKKKAFRFLKNASLHKSLREDLIRICNVQPVVQGHEICGIYEYDR